jgi:hypothetical protein
MKDPMDEVKRHLETYLYEHDLKVGTYFTSAEKEAEFKELINSDPEKAANSLSVHHRRREKVAFHVPSTIMELFPDSDTNRSKHSGKTLSAWANYTISSLWMGFLAVLPGLLLMGILFAVVTQDEPPANGGWFVFCLTWAVCWAGFTGWEMRDRGIKHSAAVSELSRLTPYMKLPGDPIDAWRKATHETAWRKAEMEYESGQREAKKED